MTEQSENRPTEQAPVTRDHQLKQYKSPKLTPFGQVAKLTQGGSFDPSSDGSTGMMGASDQRLKENIRNVGRHPYGFGLYLFNYKHEYRDTCGHGRQFGVMADEVEKIIPEAVSMHPDGYKMVNYAMLGIDRALQ